jgi:SNF2 family DNA or RNA helicase
MRGKVPYGLAHPASMGHGIDGLQDVTNIITFFGHNWNLEQYDQIIGRIGPMRQFQSGHNRLVFINHIIARDTVDELVMARRETKRTVQDLLLEAMKRRHA